MRLPFRGAKKPPGDLASCSHLDRIAGCGAEAHGEESGRASVVLRFAPDERLDQRLMAAAVQRSADDGVGGGRPVIGRFGIGRGPRSL